MTPDQQIIFDLLMKKLAGTGTPENNELLDKKLKEFVESPPGKKIIANLQSGLRIMDEWACQSKENMDAMPDEIKNIKTAVIYAASGIITGQISLNDVNASINMGIEAAYNFGLAENKRNKND